MSDYVAASASLTLAGARRVLDAALAHAGELGVAVNVSVCDVAGHEIAFVRMDGAALLSADVARDKAYTVAAFLGIPTERWFSMIEQEPAVREGIVHRDRLVIFAGGVPVLADGATVGAVGVSGGTAEQDQAVAAAGAAAISLTCPAAARPTCGRWPRDVRDLASAGLSGGRVPHLA